MALIPTPTVGADVPLQYRKPRTPTIGGPTITPTLTPSNGPTLGTAVPGQTAVGQPALGAAQSKLAEAATLVSAAVKPQITPPAAGPMLDAGVAPTNVPAQPQASAAPPPATAAPPAQTQSGAQTTAPTGQGATAPAQAGGLKSSVVPASIEQANQDFSEDVDNLLTTVSDLTSQLRQDDGSLAMLNLWAEEMQTSLNMAYNQMVQDMQKQVSQEDPAVLQAVKLINEEMKVQRQELQDQLAARGLGQSGILVEMRLRLERNALDAKERIVAGRLSELKSAMLTAITNFASHRSELLRSTFEAKTRAQQDSLNRRVALQGQLSQAVGQVADIRQRQVQTLVGQQTAREQIASQEGIATQVESGADKRAKLQADTTITVTDKQEAGANVRADKATGTQRDVAALQEKGATERTDKTLAAQAKEGQADRASRETIASNQTTSQERIASLTTQAEERIADKRIAADAANTKARIEADKSMSKLSQDTQWKIAELEATNRKSIAEMQSKDQLKAGEMNQASNIVNSLLLPMIASGKITKQEVADNLAKSDYSPEVKSIYEQALSLMPGSATSKTSATTAKPTTPSSVYEAPVSPEGKTAQATAKANADAKAVAKLEQEITDLETELETSRKLFASGSVPKATYLIGIEDLTQKISDKKAALAKLRPAPAPTPPLNEQ